MEKRSIENYQLYKFLAKNILFLFLLPFPLSRTAHSFLFLSIKRFQTSAYSNNIQKHIPIKGSREATDITVLISQTVSARFAV